MLRITVFLIILECVFCGFPQYEGERPEGYDAHAYTYGWPVLPHQAKSMCNRMGKRLCTSRDLDVFGRQGRSHCEPAWGYHSHYDGVFGLVVNARPSQCSVNMWQGVYPPNHEFGTNHAFWCLHPKIFSIAKGFPAAQSSTANHDNMGANRAVSGRPYDIFQGYRSQTLRESNPWWKVTLQSPTEIGQVHIHTLTYMNRETLKQKIESNKKLGWAKIGLHNSPILP
eukprot:109164_1